MRSLPRKFYARDSAAVAKALLGKILVRKDKKLLKARITETEAYYGKHDPASRAFTTPKLASVMWQDPGTIFVYVVHNNWLLNVVTQAKGKPGAVLIRAAEPLNFSANTRGPGLLSRSLKITKAFNGLDITKCKELFILDSKAKPKISSSHRIGVSRDLKRKLRFYIKGSRFVSKNKTD